MNHNGERFKLRADALEWQVIEGEVIALLTGTSTYIGINSAGTAMWPALAEGATRDQLSAVLQHRFRIDPDLAGRDTDLFLASLQEHNLLLAEPA